MPVYDATKCLPVVVGGQVTGDVSVIDFIDVIEPGYDKEVTVVVLILSDTVTIVVVIVAIGVLDVTGVTVVIGVIVTDVAVVITVGVITVSDTVMSGLLELELLMMTTGGDNVDNEESETPPTEVDVLTVFVLFSVNVVVPDVTED